MQQTTRNLSSPLANTKKEKQKIEQQGPEKHLANLILARVCNYYFFLIRTDIKLILGA